MDGNSLLTTPTTRIRAGPAPPSKSVAESRPRGAPGPSAPRPTQDHPIPRSQATAPGVPQADSQGGSTIERGVAASAHRPSGLRPAGGGASRCTPHIRTFEQEEAAWWRSA